MMDNLPFVSAIIPCRNEEKYIGKCLDSITQQDYPKENLEVLVVDGESQDKTKEAVGEYVKKYSYIKILDNPKKITPAAMNIGIENAKGEIVMKLDAHTTYERNYISKCIFYLKKYKADNVGGILISLPSKDTLVPKAIAISLGSPFGAGNSYIKIGAREPKWVDAVAFGCFRKEIFKKIGPYDERMIRSQDLELNQRLRKNGGKILLAPDIVGYYYPSSNLRSFFRHNFADGLWVTYPLKFGKFVFSWRHLLPLFFVVSLIVLLVISYFLKFFFWVFLGVLALYLLANFYYSFSISLKRKKLGYLFIMPIVFAIRHFGYGLGSIWGFLKIIL